MLMSVGIVHTCDEFEQTRFLVLVIVVLLVLESPDYEHDQERVHEDNIRLRCRGATNVSYSRRIKSTCSPGRISSPLGDEMCTRNPSSVGMVATGRRIAARRVGVMGSSWRPTCVIVAVPEVR